MSLNVGNNEATSDLQTLETAAIVAHPKSKKLRRGGAWRERTKVNTFHQCYRAVQLLCTYWVAAYDGWIQDHLVGPRSPSRVKHTSRALSQE